MSVVSLVLNNYIMVAVLLGLWGMLDSNVFLNKRTIRVTRIVIILIVVEAVCWGIERYTREIGYLTYTRIILAPTIYLLHAIIMLGIIEIAGFMKKHKVLLYLPLIISVPLIYTSQWTHLIYWFNDANLYVAADSILRYYPYFLFFIYVLEFVGAFTLRYAQYGTSERRGILIAIVAAAIGAVCHLIFEIDVDYSTLFSSLLLMYYLSLYMLSAKEDPLTHLLNRQCYYSEIENHKNEISAVVSIDMNDLKKINDNEGHSAGDKALMTVADCLIKAMPNNNMRGKKAFRIGGDEFTILYVNKTEDEVKADIANMRDALSKTPYVCAFGYEMIQDSNIDAAILAADEKMYKNKSLLKNSKEKELAARKEAVIRVMHEALNSGMWEMEFDDDENIKSVAWSPEFRRMVGYNDEKDFPNTLEAWSDLLHPNDKGAVLKEFYDTIVDYSGQKSYDVEYRLKVKGGEWRWFHAVGRLLRTDNGKPLTYVGMFVDITEKKDGIM